MSQYHHELENLPAWISEFYTYDSSWYCNLCEEERGDPIVVIVAPDRSPAYFTLVEVLKCLESHAEEYHF